ncbi:MAG: lysyl-tRNA synthetase, partial [Pseudomonadota bacterium]
MAVRRDKASAVRARGANPFANDVDNASRFFLRNVRRRFLSAQVRGEEAELRYDADKVTELSLDESLLVFGRITARRGFGKVSFLKLCDDGGDIQLFAKEEEMGEGFSALDDIDLGDHVEVRGPVMVTKTGELSLLVKSLRLLTKALRPLPDKHKGFTDVELRYRRRYVDLVANPEVGIALRARSIIIQGLRDFLDGHGFLEVETPTLHSVIGGAAAQPFSTHHNALDMGLFLRIAPELYLKRLLVGGFERVYEIGRCYRNEGVSTRHNPEFTMLEFYQAYATYETLLPMTEALFRHVDAYLERRLVDLGYGETYRQWCTARLF